MPNPVCMVQVSGLYIYPVKSCRGLTLNSADTDAHGLVGDRRFLVVTPDGQFLTQRQLPRMALVETGLTATTLTLASPNHGEIHVPLATNTGPRRVTVWRDTVEADDCGDEPAGWLARLLGQPVRLVHMGAKFHRPVRPSKAQPGDVVSFADGYPFLILSEASVGNLNDRIQDAGAEPVPMNRFRPNIVVTGCEAFAEDSWTRFRIGEVDFRNAGPCARCVVTTTDQLTGARGKEPLKTLATFRRAPDDPTDVNFGINLIHETKRGRLRVGDAVTMV
jgi:uncharacterized protein YcbX